MRWEQLRSNQLSRISRKSVVVFPVGAIEQHGPHLPVGTDSLISEGIALELDREFRGSLLVLPTQQVGRSDHHINFPGTLSFSHQTLEAALLEVIESVIRHGFSRIVVLNGHGGNQGLGEVVAEKSAAKWPSSQVIFTSWWRIAAEELKLLVEGDFPSVGHAGEFETSLLLLLRPELVDTSRFEDGGDPPSVRQLQGDLVTRRPAATLSRPFEELTANGVFGRPSLASVEKGKRILECVLEELVELITGYWPDFRDKNLIHY